MHTQSAIIMEMNICRQRGTTLIVQNVLVNSNERLVVPRPFLNKINDFTYHLQVKCTRKLVFKDHRTESTLA